MMRRNPEPCTNALKRRDESTLSTQDRTAFGDDHLFIDYAWMRRRLVDLFIGIPLRDQEFKGVALEEVLRRGGSALPAGPCIAKSGEKRQVDAAFRLGTRLVVVECRAAGWSIGFERGAPEAVKLRRKVVERALTDIGEKAQWLARNPVGTNYDISWATEILPIGVTPFKEFIPNLAPYPL
jgi:hypothetical protein